MTLTPSKCTFLIKYKIYCGDEFPSWDCVTRFMPARTSVDLNYHNKCLTQIPTSDSHQTIYKDTSTAAHTHSLGVLLGRRLNTTVLVLDSATWRRPAHTLCVRGEKWRLGKESGLEKEISSMKLFTLTSVCRTSSALSPLSVSETPLSENWGSRWARLYYYFTRPEPHGVNEMISPAHLKWTKTA